MTFERGLILLTLLGLAARLAYAFAVAGDLDLPGDAIIYRQLGAEVANGYGYSQVPGILFGDRFPTAQHPPLFPLYLAAWTKLGLGSLAAHRVACCLTGAAAVALIGLVGRRVGGASVGLVAAAIAAFYPLLIMGDGSLVAESLYVPLIALSMLVAYRLLDRPGAVPAIGLGAVIGLATLTRSDALLLVPLLVLPLAYRLGRARLPLLAVCLLATALVLSPWLARNWLVLDRFPLLSTNGGFTARAANCNTTYYSPHFVGFVSHKCAAESSCSKLAAEAEVARSECLQRQATSYARHHADRVPLVVLARVERMWELYDPALNLDYGKFWARPKGLATAGLVFYVILLPLALAGFLLLRARGVPLLPLLAMLLLVTAVAALTFGVTRYRTAAEPALIVLAAVSLDRLGRSLRGSVEEGRRPGVHARA